jgi:hypothetical protein
MEIEDSQRAIESIVEVLVKEREGNDDPTDEFLTELIVRCHGKGLSRGDVEFCLQERFGDSPRFTELFKDVWSDCDPASVRTRELKSSAFLEDTPLIPDSVFIDLPCVLKKGAKVFNDKRQRDVFLITAISAISSVLPTVNGLYSGDRVFPLLYAFVVAPAASGKSAMKYAGMLVETIHRNKKAASDEKRRVYEIEKREYDRKMRNPTGQVGEPPIEPTREVHFIPGNSSSASVISQLDANKGVGLIFETEADSLSNTFASEWGNFSDILRKNFHHEPIRSARKTNGEYREIEQSKFSIALTGTPGQVPKLIQSSEDGMFSRLSLYLFASPIRWIDPSPKNHPVNLNDHFILLSEQVTKIHDDFKSKNLTFTLSDEQWELHKGLFSSKLDTMTSIFGDEASGVIYRLGLTCFRIAMTLTAVDAYDSDHKGTELKCPDSIFFAALGISKVLMDHSLLVYVNLPKQEGVPFKSDYRIQLLDSLPDQFSRKEAVQRGREVKHSERTVDGMLRDWVDENRLTKVRNGVYAKQSAAP